MVLQQQPHAAGERLVRGLREHGDDVQTLALDQLGLSAEVRAVEAGREPQRRRADRRRTRDPAAHARHAFGDGVPAGGRADEVAHGEDAQTRARRPRGERAQRVVVALAHVVQSHAHALALELAGLVEDVLDRDRAGLEPEMPAERVDPETDQSVSWPKSQ